MCGSATQLSSYDVFKAAIAGEPALAAVLPSGSVAQHVAASLAASLLTVTVMNPLDVISSTYPRPRRNPAPRRAPYRPLISLSTRPPRALTRASPRSLPVSRTARLYQSAGRATQYRGPLDCAAQLLRAEGIGALQKGWLAQFARLGPHTVLTFVFLERVRPLFLAVDAFVVQ